MSNKYSPKSFFYTDPAQLMPADTNNYATDAYGPVAGSETLNYRTTSKVRSSSKTKVYAICKGRVLIQPYFDLNTQEYDGTKINLILKPSTSYAPLKIKYFIYRGVDKADWINGSNLMAKDNTNTTQPTLLQKIWDAFTAFNTALYVAGVINNPPDSIAASLIGYDPNQPATSLLDDLFFSSDSSFQLAICDEGDYIGNFTGVLGLDIVLDYGDYKLENQKELFQFNLAFARNSDNVFNTMTVYDSNDTQNVLQTKIKRYQEYIHYFMDAAAFWGSHINCGEIKLINIPPNYTIYSDILAKYQTKNNVYVYIRDSKGLSYNYNSTRKVGGFKSDPEPYINNGWPILIETTFVNNISSVPITLEYSIDPNIDAIDRNLLINVISPNNSTEEFPLSQHIKNLIPVVLPATTSVGTTTPFLLNFLTSGTSLCATFLMIFCKIELALNNYFDYLWPANMNSVFVPEDSSNGNYSSWATYDKNMITSISPILNVGASIQQKVVFDVGTNVSNTAAPTAKRRLYIASIKSNTNHSDEFNFYNKDTVTSGFDESQTTADQFAVNAYNDLGFAIYKGQFKDGSTTINSLSLRNDIDLKKPIGIFQLGITEKDYNKLVYNSPTVPTAAPGSLPAQLLPYDANNIYFDLFETPLDPLVPNVKKYQLGLRYEDNSGNDRSTVTALYQTQNIVYVYSVDGLFFFSKDYSDYQNFAQSLPASSAFFRPTTNYNGEFGFDWMRMGDTSSSGDTKYENITGKLYTDTGRTTIDTDANQYKTIDPQHLAIFKQLPSLYQKLEYEYDFLIVQPDSTSRLIKQYLPILTIYPPYVAGNSIELDNQSIFGASTDISVNRTAQVKLSFNVKVAPIKMELSYNTAIINIQPVTLPLSTGRQSVNLTINCLSEFATREYIKVLAYYPDAPTKGKVIGALAVKPNNKLSRKTKKFVLVEVQTNILNLTPPPTLKTSVSDRALSLKKFLRQLLISPVIEHASLNLIGAATFTNNYVKVESVPDPNDSTQQISITSIISQNSQLGHALTPFDSLEGFLYDQLGTAYDDCIRIYLLPDIGGSIDESGNYKGLNGYNNPKTHEVVMFSDGEKVSHVHEALHALQLTHSFAAYEAFPYIGSGLYSFQPETTDNIMDYSHLLATPINRITLWNWQGTIARNNSDPEP